MMDENRIPVGEASGSFESIEVDIHKDDAFERIRAFLDPAYTSDDEIRKAIEERGDMATIKITRWFTLPRPMFRRLAPQIGDPTNAPSVAQLMEDLNTALGNPPLGAESITPKAVWERLLRQVRERGR